jgi:hypothetical protein
MPPTLKEAALAALGTPGVLIFITISIPLGAPVVSCILLAFGVAQ